MRRPRRKVYFRVDELKNYYDKQPPFFTKRDVRAIAIYAHGEQKYGRFPYIMHLDEVHKILLHFGYSQEYNHRFTAYLHDVLEDTSFPMARIETIFGKEVAQAVDAISLQVTEGRKGYYYRLRENPIAVVVKQADRIANMIASLSWSRSEKKYQKYISDYPEFSFILQGLGDANMWKCLEQLYNGNIPAGLEP